jgi:hypothetical protein
MTLSTTILYIAVLGLSGVIAYLYWIKIRVIRLQQEIFDKRDDLFDRAAELNALDDSAYQSARYCLNGLVRFVPYLSLPLVIYMVSHDNGTEETLPKSSNLELQHSIDEVFSWTAQRLYRYIVRETATGWVVWLVFEVILNPPFVRAEDTEDVVDKKALRGVERVIRSESISRVADVTNCAPA